MTFRTIGAAVMMWMLAQGCTCARSGLPGRVDGSVRVDTGLVDVRVNPGDGSIVLGDGQVCNTTGGGTATREPATIMFVIDTSGSMSCAPSTTQNECNLRQACYQTEGVATCDARYPDSRWPIFRPAMATAVSAIPDGHFIGMLHYPVGVATAQSYNLTCPPPVLVPIAAAVTSRSAVVQQLMQIVPIGPTPTSSAVLAGLNQLQNSSASASKVLVLSTDGAANCDANCNCVLTGALAPNHPDTRALVAAVQQAVAQGIRTYVIAVPGSAEWVPVLQEIATAGNGRLFDLNQSTATFARDLSTAFGEITNSTITCSYTIPQNSGSFDVGNVNVRYTNAQGAEMLIPRATAASRNGWDYDNVNNPTRIELIGPTCETLRMAQGGRVDVLFGCPTVLQ